jgi:hypothetical protein
MTFNGHVLCVLRETEVFAAISSRSSESKVADRVCWSSLHKPTSTVKGIGIICVNGYGASKLEEP